MVMLLLAGIDRRSAIWSIGAELGWAGGGNEYRVDLGSGSVLELAKGYEVRDSMVASRVVCFADVCISRSPGS
jgi:hypothetical protein